jgi:hypothetical protein
MKIDKSRGIVGLVLALAAMAASACADPSQSLFPTAPSGVIASSPTLRPDGPALAPFARGGRVNGVAGQ